MNDDLFGYPHTPGFVFSSATSAMAAASLSPDHLSRMRAMIYAIIKIAPAGYTCDEIEVAFKLRHQTASARLRELELSGHLVKGDKRKTRSGRMARVYRVA